MYLFIKIKNTADAWLCDLYRWLFCGTNAQFTILDCTKKLLENNFLRQRAIKSGTSRSILGTKNHNSYNLWESTNCSILKQLFVKTTKDCHTLLHMQ